MFFLHAILSYLAASIFRDPMLNCFWTECCSFILLSPSLEVATMPFRDPSAESLASLIFFGVFKISVNKKFGYENFGSF